MTEAGGRVIRYVANYLAGALNEPAHEAWVLAIHRATRDGAALDTGLKRICEAYLAATAVGPTRRSHTRGAST